MLPNNAENDQSLLVWTFTESWPCSAVLSITTQPSDTNTTPACANIWLHALATFGLLVGPADS